MELSAWEGSKENIQPLKRGRDPKLLTQAVSQVAKASRSSDAERHRGQRDAFEEKLQQAQAQDVLSVWLEYIKWAQEAGTSDDGKSELSLLERACQACDLQTYRADPKFLRLWILYADKVRTPLDVFTYLWAKEIGVEHALLYEAWASTLEMERRFEHATQIYELGVARKAAPLERLQRRQQAFQDRMAERFARDGDVQMAPPEPERLALNPLKRQEAKSFVRPTDDRRGFTQDNLQGQAQGGAPSYEVFHDPNAKSDVFGGEEHWGTAFPSELQRRKENSQKPVPVDKWRSVKLKQGCQGTQGRGSALDVFCEEDRALEAEISRPAAPLAVPRCLDKPMEPTPIEVVVRAKPDPNDDVSYEERRLAACMQAQAQAQVVEPTMGLGELTGQFGFGEVTTNQVSRLVSSGYMPEPTCTNFTGRFVGGSEVTQGVLQLFASKASPARRHDMRSPAVKRATPRKEIRKTPQKDFLCDERPQSKPAFEIPDDSRPKSKCAFEIPDDSRPKAKAAFDIPDDSRPKAMSAFAIPDDSRPQAMPAFEIPDDSRPKAKAAFEIPDDSRPRAKPAFEIPDDSRPKAKAAFEIPDDSRPKAMPAFGIPDDSRPKAQPAFGIPDDSPAAAVPAFGIPDDSRPKAQPAFGIPDDSPAAAMPAFGIPDDSRPRSLPAFGIPDDSRPKAQPAFTMPDDQGGPRVPKPAPSKLAELCEEQWSPPRAAVEVSEALSGLRAADLPRFRAVSPESTAYSQTQAHPRALFPAEDSDFLIRAPGRISFGTDVGSAVRPATSARDLMRALDETSPGAASAEPGPSDDQENEGLWPARHGALSEQDHARALQPQAVPAPDYIEVDQDEFESEALHERQASRIRANEGGKYNFAIFEDPETKNNPVARNCRGAPRQVMDFDPSFLAGQLGPQSSGQDIAQLYAALRARGPLFEHSGQLSACIAGNQLRLPTGRVIELSEPLASNTAIPAREHGRQLVVERSKDVAGSARAWVAQQSLGSSWTSFDEVHVFAVDGVVVECLEITAAAPTFATLPVGAKSASRALAEVGALLADAHRKGVVHAQVSASAFLLSGQGTRLERCFAPGEASTGGAALCCPELLQGTWSFQVDHFGLAELAYELLCGERLRVWRQDGQWHFPQHDETVSVLLNDLLNVPLGSMTAEASSAQLFSCSTRARQYHDSLRS